MVLHKVCIHTDKNLKDKRQTVCILGKVNIKVKFMILIKRQSRICQISKSRIITIIRLTQKNPLRRINQKQHLNQISPLRSIKRLKKAKRFRNKRNLRVNRKA